MLNACGSQENDKFYGVKWETIVTDNFIRDTVGGNVFFKISDNDFACLAAQGINFKIAGIIVYCAQVIFAI